MTGVYRTASAIALTASVCACTLTPPSEPSAVVISRRAQVVAPERVRDAVAIGRSTRADVRAALGDTLVIRFDNGYEVWLYRLAEETPPTLAERLAGVGSQRAARDTAAEFVILFAPSGVVAKTRTRLAPGAA